MQSQLFRSVQTDRTLRDVDGFSNMYACSESSIEHELESYGKLPLCAINVSPTVLVAPVVAVSGVYTFTDNDKWT